MKAGIPLIKAIALQFPSERFTRNIISTNTIQILPKTNKSYKATKNFPRIFMGVHSVINKWESGITIPSSKP